MDEMTLLFIGLIIAYGLICDLGRRISNMNRTIGDTNRKIDLLDDEIKHLLDKENSDG